jgi:hypothetical protein
MSTDIRFVDVAKILNLMSVTEAPIGRPPRNRLVYSRTWRNASAAAAGR